MPDHDVCAPGMRHEVRRQLDLVATIGFHGADDSLTFRCLPVDRESMRMKLLLAAGSVERPTVVVHLGATAMSRACPAERLGAAARRIAEACGAQIVFVGSEADAEACAAAQAAMDGMPSLSFAGRLSLGELGVLIAEARVLVCHHGAPAHIASAVGTPAVVLDAPTHPQHTPWRVPSRVLNHAAPWQELADATLKLWREAESRRDTRREIRQKDAHLELHTA